jgi:CheY-like chemotaxis protein
MTSFPILYVEDEDSDIFLLHHVFAKEGVPNPLQAVKDGREAIEYLAGRGSFANRKQHPLPGLMLLDLNLPYWSGFEVLAWVRQQPQCRRLPVLIFSSSSRPDDIARAYDAGANAYLVKPSSLNELSALIRSLRDFWLLRNQLPEGLCSPPTHPGP